MSVIDPKLPTQLAAKLAKSLEERQIEYAIGGALALGYWISPRATLDVDLTLFLPHDQPSRCLQVLSEIGCQFDSVAASASLLEHGFCRISSDEVTVDVFVPINDFYQVAQQRRRRVVMANQDVWIWDAATLAVFKLMFFRRKDIADLEMILRSQGRQLDRIWIREQMVEMFGRRDPRVSTWDELVTEVPVAE
jgi:predicted nucleotidyltransferase